VSPKRQVIDQAHRVLAAARRVGFSGVAQKRLEQAIEWMESEARDG
jgi:hypothetical protein